MSASWGRCANRRIVRLHRVGREHGVRSSSGHVGFGNRGPPVLTDRRLLLGLTAGGPGRRERSPNDAGHPGWPEARRSDPAGGGRRHDFVAPGRVHPIAHRRCPRLTAEAMSRSRAGCPLVGRSGQPHCYEPNSLPGCRTAASAATSGWKRVSTHAACAKNCCSCCSSSGLRQFVTTISAQGSGSAVSTESPQKAHITGWGTEGVSLSGPLEDGSQPAQPARKPATWWEAWRSRASPVMS